MQNNSNENIRKQIQEIINRHGKLESIQDCLPILEELAERGINPENWLVWYSDIKEMRLKE